MKKEKIEVIQKVEKYKMTYPENLYQKKKPKPITNVFGHKPQKVLKEVNFQTGYEKNPIKDSRKKALAPGKRISKSGKVYYEYRANRSDIGGKKKI